ncbi:MAG TPA: signal peptidase I [Candidatus Paceibacterota bacterium]|nr:signal peptidase I [Candidatus Paceibacterota bacterium]
MKQAFSTELSAETLNTFPTVALPSSIEAAPQTESTRRVTWISQSLQVLLVMILASLSYLLFSHYVFQSVQVVGASMWPTLQDSDHYFLNRWAYHVHSPQRNDIVVVKDPSDGVFVVKRIIAGPGDSLLFKNGHVFLNGKRLNEPYVSSGKLTFPMKGPNQQLIVCGADQYYVLGDNRDNSFDSRMYGPVRRQNILGPVML